MTQAKFLYYFQAPLGVSNRDFIQKRCFIKDYPKPGMIMISFQSTTHSKVPPTKGAVRADTHIAGYIMKPVNNGRDTELYIISQVDIKVNIKYKILVLIIL